MMPREPKSGNLIPSDREWQFLACWHFGSFLTPYLGRSILSLLLGESVGCCSDYITFDLEILEYDAVPHLGEEFVQC